MSRYVVIALALAPLFVSAAEARSKCQYFSDGREPRCHVVSDGAREPYVDDRKNSGFSDEFRRRNGERVQRRQAWRRGAAHTEDMASGGTRTSSGIVVSPFVPGSREDQGWQAERKRRGLCGNDRLCLSAN